MSDIAAPDDEIPELEETQIVDDIVSAEPLPPTNLETGKVEPETIEIVNKAAVLPYVVPQKSKFWHFQFKDVNNQTELTKVLESIPEFGLTVEYGDTQKSPDITLKDRNTQDIVGKIHLLLCDRRHANLPEKYYVKLYFYDFKDNQLYDAVKSKLTNFFENFKPITSNSAQQGGKKRSKKHRTMKKRRVNRKKTHRRK
jgi:hypothetical protein